MSAPIGEREDSHLEFKRADALSSGIPIVRAVVALLNTDGGTVWVGVTEQSTRAVAAEPIPQIDRAIENLQNQLIDLIEPKPQDSEIRILRNPCPGRLDGEILRIEVTRAGRGPFALLEQSGRKFLVRVGSRNRLMTYEELAKAFGREEPEPPWLADRERAAPGKPGLWMSVRPPPSLSLDVQSPELAALLTDARKVGHRPTGWSYVSTLGYRQLDIDSAYTEAIGYQRSAIFSDGRIELWCSFERLNDSNVPGAISPFALIELPLSVFRLAKEVLALGQVEKGVVWVDFAMFGGDGRTLLSGSPLGFSPRPPGKLDGDLLLPQPLRFTVDELRSSPEKCNLRLVTLVYQGFGLERDALPAELDQTTAVLNLRA